MSEPIDAPPSRPITPNVARAGWIMMASIFLSRVLGILRDSVMAAKFGVGIDTDAYRLAFLVPDLIFFAVAGGALSSAFIPIFSEYFHTDREDDAWKLFSVVTTLMSLLVVAFIVLAWIFAYPLAQALAPGKPDELMPLIVTMSRIVLPAQFAFFVGGLMFGTLYARQVFAIPGLGPNVYNLGIIFGALVLSAFVSPGIVGMSWGALIGAVLGSFVIPLIAMARMGARFRPSLDVKHPGVKKVFKLMAPVVFGLSLPGVYGIIMQAYGSYYQVGINTALDLSNKVMQAPMGVIGQGLALAVFPALAQHFAQGEMGRFRTQLGLTMRTVLYLSLPVSALVWVLAPEAVTLLFEYGKARTANLDALTGCLRMFALGIWAWCLHPILMRAFFAVHRSAMPILLGTLTTGLFFGLVVSLKDTALSYLALPLASSIAAAALALSLVAAAHRTVGPLEVGALAKTFGQSAVGAAAAGLAAFGLAQLAPLGDGLGANALAGLKLVGIGLVAGWIYYAITRWFGMPETETIRKALRKFERAES